MLHQWVWLLYCRQRFCFSLGETICFEVVQVRRTLLGFCLSFWCYVRRAFGRLRIWWVEPTLRTEVYEGAFFSGKKCWRHLTCLLTVFVMSPFVSPFVPSAHTKEIVSNAFIMFSNISRQKRRPPRTHLTWQKILLTDSLFQTHTCVAQWTTSERCTKFYRVILQLQASRSQQRQKFVSVACTPIAREPGRLTRIYAILTFEWTCCITFESALLHSKLC